MEVKLIAKTYPINGASDMDVVEYAACTCYNSSPTPDHKIAKGCYNTGHLSVYEHISFTFKITGVSRALLAQLTRHRHASFSVQSQRYVSYEDGFDYVNPFNKSDPLHNVFVDDMRVCQDQYNKYIHAGKKNEDARAALPNACCTELVFTMNARALIESGYLRLCTRAQKEIRELYEKMRDEVMKYSPEIGEKMVPQCEKNKKYPFCTEHKSCGRHPKLKDVYNPVSI